MNLCVCICKEGKCVGLGQERACLHEVGGNTLKGGGIEKKGWETILNRGAIWINGWVP